MPRMCAVLYSKNVVFVGLNSARTSTLQARYADRPDRIATHAEISALAQAIRHHTKIRHTRRSDWSGIDLSGYKIAIARVLANGDTALARPCAGCSAALRDFGISCIQHT